MKSASVLLFLAIVQASGQEVKSGFELRSTITLQGAYSNELSEPPRSGSPVIGSAGALLYPTWKIDQHWTVSGSVLASTRPFFPEQFSTQGYGAKADVLQANISYSQLWKDKSIVLRAGELSSAFGSFLLRYDGMENPLIDMPLTYGYYYKGVTNYGLAGAQADITVKKLDARAQFTTSSPANRRSILDSDQYGNWAGGVGYTIAQGFRVGASGYYGPYLHRQHPYYRRGEAKPSELPAAAAGIDVAWARGYWTTYGELQWFYRSYRVMPAFTQDSGYGEVRRVLHPRWYVAGRIGYLRSSFGGTLSSYEGVAGFRPNRFQLIKAGYETRLSSSPGRRPENAFVIQLVSAVRLFGP